MSSHESHQQHPASEEAGAIDTVIEQHPRSPATSECGIAPGAVGHLIGGQARFLALWIVSGTNYFSYAMMQLSLVLLAARLTRSPLLVSGVGFLQILPAFVFGLFAGALGDRYDRRRILLLATALRLSALALAFLAALLGFISLPLLSILALILGMTEAVEEPALAAAVPMVVPRAMLERANTLLVGAQNVLGLVADPLGALLVSVSAALVLGASALCAGGALIALLCLRGSLRPAHVQRAHLGADILEGLRYLWHERLILTIGLMAGVINACWSGYLVVMVLYAVRPGPLGLTAPAYGLLLAVISVGSILGAVLTIPVQRWLGRRWAIGLNILGNGLMFVTPALTTNLWLIGGAMLIGGLASPMWTIAIAALQGRVVPAELQSRVNAAYRTLAIGASAVGPILGGLSAQWFGLRTTLASFGGLTWLMLIPFFCVVTERAMTRSHKD